MTKVGGAAVALLLLAACSFQRTRDPSSPATPAPPEASPRVTDAAPRATANQVTSEPVRGGGPGASFVLRLNDQNGLHPPGIPVRISGPQNKTVSTDEAGEVKFAGPAGIYNFEVVVGCGERIDVTSGGKARVGMSSGTASRGDLEVVWQHRIAPGPPVFAPERDWGPGEKVEVRYTASDRCTQKPAPNAAYPTYRFEPSRNVKVVDTPVLRSDAQARGRVFLSCIAPGEVSLTAVDRENVSDSRDLMKDAVGYGGAPSCAG